MFRLLLLFSTLCLSGVFLHSCTRAYERYMEAGKSEFQKHELSKARDSFHKAVQEGRKNAKQSAELQKALLQELECTKALSLTDESVKVLTELAAVAGKEKNFEQAATYKRQIADLYAADGNSYEAESAYNDVLSFLDNAGLPQSRENALANFGIADLRKNRKNYKAAVKYMEQACNLLLEINDSDTHLLATRLHDLAFIYSELNRDNDAIAADEKAKSIEIGGIGSQVHKIIPKI
ncbi:MAG: tetratricopeptide repeat protein [Candidatus Obscuribacterales bacterium]|nr:tetratricopeptide repeat protein [Candidatus Obscuribacterales bacterium]